MVKFSTKLGVIPVDKKSKSVPKSSVVTVTTVNVGMEPSTPTILVN